MVPASMNALPSRRPVPRGAALIALALLVAAAGPAAAQAPTPGPTVPLAMDLMQVPVGTWSEYQVKVGDTPGMQQRFALVGRQDRIHVVEMQIEGGMAMAVGPVLLRVDLDPTDPKQRLRKVIMRMGSAEPMELPTQAAAAGQEPFRTLDPKKAVKNETITVPAGTFKTKLYRDNLPDGSLVEYWVSQDAPPFGVVKARAQLKRGGPMGAGGAMDMVLSGRGTGAKAQLTQPARPFDQMALMQQLMNANGRGAPAAQPPAPAGPPPAPAAPAPPPAAPAPAAKDTPAKKTPAKAPAAEKKAR
jgi:hypothetical protein